MNDEIELIMSPLCKTFEKDGISLQVEIYRSQHSEWTLEVVNPSNTSIVWDDTFLSDQAALDEFHQTVRDEGMRSFVDNHGSGAA
ncbi:MAG: hypothetical protein ACE5G3_06910 [Gammaproteobacteria bacterium]